MVLPIFDLSPSNLGRHHFKELSHEPRDIKKYLSGEVIVLIAKNPALEIEMKITVQRRAVKMLPVKYFDSPSAMRITSTYKKKSSGIYQRK